MKIISSLLSILSAKYWTDEFFRRTFKTIISDDSLWMIYILIYLICLFHAFNYFPDLKRLMWKSNLILNWYWVTFLSPCNYFLRGVCKDSRINVMITLTLFVTQREIRLVHHLPRKNMSTKWCWKSGSRWSWKALFLLPLLQKDTEETKGKM